jgi:hypothetical protein
MCQAIDRLRLIHGRPDREIYILCDLPLPGVTIDRYRPLDEILAGGTRYERAWVAKGILSAAPADLHQLHPELWPTPDAAKKWLSRHPLLTGDKLQLDITYYSLSLVRVAYRRSDRQGGPLSLAFVDTRRHLDPRAALEAALGPLSEFRVVTGGGQAEFQGNKPSRRPLPPRSRTIPSRYVAGVRAYRFNRSRTKRLPNMHRNGTEKAHQRTIAPLPSPASDIEKHS